MGAERSIRAAVVAALGVALMAGCDAPTVPRAVAAYNPTQLTGGLVYHWSRGKTIAIYVDPTGVPAGYDLAAATREAAARWEGRTFYDEFRFAFVSRPDEADVIVHDRFAQRLVDVFDCDAGSGAGETTICAEEPEARVLPLLDGGGGRVKVDVGVDPLAPSEQILVTADQTRAEYLVTLIAHELGHVLGIGGHSNSNGDLMNAIPRVRFPSVNDGRTLRAVLRQEPDVRL
jgi:predicted Zn-dependent protease